MTTCRDIVKGALRKIQALGRGESLDSEDAEIVRASLNAILATITAQGGFVFTNAAETFTLDGSTSYTIGSGGDFDTSIPREIMAATYTIDGADYPLDVIDVKRYADIQVKSTQGYPDFLYFDYGHPLAKIYLYPVPSSGTLKLYSKKPLTSFTSLDSDFSMPAEYQAMLEYNAAVWVAPEFEVAPSQSVMMIAQETKQAVLAQNSRFENNELRIDSPQRHGRFNIYTGEV